MDFVEYKITRNACITNPLVVHGLSIGIKNPDECFGPKSGWQIGCPRLVEFGS